MQYQPYPDYIRISNRFYDSIPEGWELRKMKFMAAIQNGRDHKEVESEEGFNVFGSGGIFAKATEYLHDGESVLFGRKGTIDAPLYVNEKFWTVDTMYYTIVHSNTVPRFLYYLAKAIPFQYLATQTTLPSMTQFDLGNFLLCFPKIEEQKRIAIFLDYKTGQIDQLIEKKKALIEKLEEKRIAVITQAVTKGLDKNSKTKPSGVDWLGDMPEHWDVRALKFCCNFLNNRRIPLSAEERTGMERNYPYYGASGVIDYVLDYIYDEPTVLIAEDGANLLSRSTDLAFIAEGKYWVNNHAHILKPIEGEFSFWANLLCIVKYEPWVTGSAQPKLSKENLGSIPLPYPPINEQREISLFITNQLGKIEPMKKKAKDVVDRLGEYRSAIITSAVTGKIDVRGIEIPKEVT